MEKNISIIDLNGKLIGQTYPKRAKGLVKNGRAEYAGDCTIRLLVAHSSTIYDQDMEVEIMSNVINFSTRDFSFDTSRGGVKAGNREFITDFLGDTVEIFHIGNKNGDSTFVSCFKNLEANTEYIFRFGEIHKSTADEDLQFIVVPFMGDDMSEDDWDNRYTFNISGGKFKAKLNKNLNGERLSIFEIPFNSGMAQKFKLFFKAENCEVCLVSARNLEEYASLEDYVESKKFFEKKIDPSDWFAGVDFSKVDTQKFADKMKEMADTVSNSVKNIHFNFGSSESNECAYDMRGKNLYAGDIASALLNLDDGQTVKLSNSNLKDSEVTIEAGNRADECTFFARNCNIGGQAFTVLVNKGGDECKYDFSNSNITAPCAEVRGEDYASDGCIYKFNNCCISEAAIANLMKIIGDGVTMDFSNASIDEDYTIGSYDCETEGSTFIFKNARVSENVISRFREAIEGEDGSSIQR